MYRNLKKVLFILLSAVLVGCCVAAVGCNKNKNKYDGFFAGESHNYVLTSDYTITEADVKGTEGNDNVTLNYICTFNLDGHTLNLGGYTLNVVSSSNEVVKFENGKITNGSLNISVPNGDIEFTGTEIDDSVTYELEAASETIKFSNAVISGKCTVKSNTHVNVEYSNVGDITLAGNGTLTAGSGASLGAVTVSEQASGAKVNISPSASVQNMELQAAASVSVAGNVSSVKVAESAKNDSASLSIKIEETASVDKVELNAAASVSVAGSVQAVVVAESAKNDSASLSINVADTAEITRVELNAPAAVEVSGGVSNIVVADTAGGSSVTLKETATVATVAVNAGNTKIESENANVSKVVVSESVKDSVTATNVTVTTATQEEMEDYLAHQHIFVTVSRVEATCTTAGEVNSVCECGETSKKTLPALGHSYVYSVVKEPTETEKGQGLYTCSRCGDKYTVDIENYVSVSMVVDGLHYLFSAIPDGVYNITSDKTSPIKAVQGSDNSFTLEEAEAVIEVRNGNLSGTFNCKVVITEKDYADQTMQYKARIDGNTIYAYYYALSDRASGSKFVDEGGMYVTLSSLINMGLAQFLPVDVEEYADVLTYLEKISAPDITLPELPGGILVKALEAVCTKATENGNTVYTLDPEKLVAALDTLGAKTIADLIDGVVGEGAFDAVKALADGIADKNVLAFATEVYAVAEQFGISQDDLFALVQLVLDKVAPEAEINFKDLVLSYYNKTVADVVADIMGEGTTAAQVKTMIAQYSEQYLGMCEQTTVSALVEMVAGNFFDEGEGEEEEEPGLYDMLLQMVGVYAENVTLTVTANADNKILAYVISYTDESGIKVSITKSADSSIPAIDVDVMGVKAEVTETEKGAQAVVDVMGMLFTLTAENTKTGATLNFKMDMEEASADVDLAIKVNTENGVYGAEFELDGEIKPASTKSESMILSGKLKAEKNDSVQIDKSVWDSFEGDKSMFYHMDVTMYHNYGKEYEAVRLQYVSEEEGEYYLLTKTVWQVDFDGILETLYSAKLLSIKGLPEVMLIYENDCADSLMLSFTCTALAEVTQTKILTGTIKLNDYGFTVENGTRGEAESLGTYSTEFYGNCYYNGKTGEASNSSSHSFKYSGVYVEGGTSCSDGIIVTTTCEKCDYIRVERQNSHYYIDDRFYLDTQCGNDDYVAERECIVCHTKAMTDQLYSHNISRSYKEILTAEEYNGLAQYDPSISNNCIKVDDLAANYGFDITGFYYGTLTLKHCSICGLNVYVYTYYTNTTADGCKEHVAYVVEYKGNSDYKAFDYKKEVSHDGHYSVRHAETEYSNVSVAVKVAEAVLGGKLLFTPEYASYYVDKCLGCDMLMSKHILLSDKDKGEYEIYIYYADGKDIDSWNYEIYVYDTQLTVAEAAKYDQEIDGATSGNFYGRVYSNGNSNIELNLSNDDTELTLNAEIYDDNGGMYVNVYYISECKEVESRYDYEDGEWTLYRSTENERHNYIYDYVYGENCREDGFYFSTGCIICGEGDENVDVMHYHSDYYYDGIYFKLPGLYAETYGIQCSGCESFIHLTIVLQEDWTLTEDVYIKAEGLTLDLNGYTIDLNGHHLALYSYMGEQLVITDNTFDTSLIEEGDPSDIEFNSSITNSQEEGVLIVVSCAALNENDGEENVIFGTVAIECAVYASDTDDRHSLYESFANWTDNDGEKIGYDLPLLRS